jgi:hypothetical protein
MPNVIMLTVIIQIVVMLSVASYIVILSVASYFDMLSVTLHIVTLSVMVMLSVSMQNVAVMRVVEPFLLFLVPEMILVVNMGKFYNYFYKL